MCARKSLSLSLSVLSLCQRKSVAKRLFDSVLAIKKNHIFLNEARWARLENKTPREIMNMVLKQPVCEVLAEKQRRDANI